MVANFLVAPPPIRIFCGDDHLRQGENGLRFDDTSGIITGPSPTCAASLTMRGYVLISPGTSCMIILCPFGLTFPNTIEGARFVQQTDMPLDYAVGVSGTLLHEFLHIASRQSKCLLLVVVDFCKI